jgi:hypothetical protein
MKEGGGDLLGLLPKEGEVLEGGAALDLRGKVLGHLHLCRVACH